MKWFKLLSLICIAGMLYAGSEITLEDISNGASVDGYNVYNQTKSVEIPDNFVIETANLELKNARISGNKELANKISQQIHEYWKQNRDLTLGPEEQGNNSQSGPNPNMDTRSRRKDDDPSPNRWGDDVRIAPENEVYDVDIVSLSNGELYSISIWFDGSNDHRLMHRSTDNGQTWTLYGDWDTGGVFWLSSVGLFVSSDTIIQYYILTRDSDGYMSPYVRVLEPGAPNETVLYFGSPYGGVYQDFYISDLNVCTDGVLYPGGAYVYATWCEDHGSPRDSTRVMFARSDELDVGSWEIGPTSVSATSGGSEAYYKGSRIAFGYDWNDMMWIVAWLHPFGYPTFYDRNVRGWYSTNYGNSWSPFVRITPSDNGYDETAPAIAGSHINRNWVCWVVRNDTSSSIEDDLYNYYSTDDGTNWNSHALVIGAMDCFLPDMWVDDSSTAFFGAFRRDETDYEEVRYKVGDIADPSLWLGSVQVNDDRDENLSGTYGPSISYNYGDEDAIIAWTSFEGTIYSIWFDSESWVGVVEERPDGVSAVGFISLAPNPSNDLIKLTYNVKHEGNVKISLYDATGRLVNNLINSTKQPGDHSLNINNNNLAAGIYFIRIKTSEGIYTTPMAIVR